MRIEVFKFAPFESRPNDEVVGLRFEYDEPTVAVLKQALADRRPQVADAARGIRVAGGWLSSHRCWFVELPAWHAVRTALRDHDHATRFEVIECPAGITQYLAPGTVAP